MIRIKKVVYLHDYQLALTFTDQKTKIVDLRKYKDKGPETVFYPFRDIEFFKSVKVDKHTGTIVWPNGVDLCPDVLYETGVEINEYSGVSDDEGKNSVKKFHFGQRNHIAKKTTIRHHAKPLSLRKKKNDDN